LRQQNAPQVQSDAESRASYACALSGAPLAYILVYRKRPVAYGKRIPVLSAE